MIKNLEVIKNESRFSFSYTACMLCGSSEYVLISDVCRYGVKASNVVCKKCGLVYINPRPDAKQLQQYYKNQYRQLYDNEDLNSEKYLSIKKTKAQFISKYIAEKSKILEVGCANGILLNEFLKINDSVELFGVEPTLNLAISAKKRFNIQIFADVFENYKIEEKKFDFVILDHVLEHFANPVDVLIKIRKILKDTGTIYIEVPDIYQPYGDLEKNFLQHVHMHNFSLKTLKVLFKLTGFEIIDCNMDSCLGCFVKKSQQIVKDDIDFIREGDNWKTIIEFLEMYKNYSKVKNAKNIAEKDFYSEEILKTDIVLENKKIAMYLEVLKEKMQNASYQNNKCVFNDQVKKYISGIGKSFIEAVRIFNILLKN